ncbi:30S ribosomal protein S4 [Candidatus Nasuia deltocephalinicola]|uniref:Small ribosomal subunit protein uS4 n=1 Tax=Candidatus Nasuia deltocephalincola TaxID=1160784 RepID=A0A974WMV2_9PROT|nr:30S ribosomal protein S4 [Candidatus Nasuia deltocephalinicola]WKD87137.1 30S ribosomal protein S4 [Candidatus Nasuia deltocephalinicola]BEH03929.1 30S ribosomal protein S4 [Candidatus Nasuia deltocephalinicola]
MVILKKYKLYKKNFLNLFLKNGILSKFNYINLQNKIRIKNNNFYINTHYSDQLKEKRKLKIIYGVSEKKYNFYYNFSKKLSGDISKNILILLESRLDNFVYRSGFASSRLEAKQMIRHGFINLNYNLLKYSSKILKPGDYICLNYKKNNYFRKNYFFFYYNNNFYPKWIFLNKNNFSSYLKRFPTFNELKPIIDIKDDFIVGNCKL